MRKTATQKVIGGLKKVVFPSTLIGIDDYLSNFSGVVRFSNGLHKSKICVIEGNLNRWSGEGISSESAFQNALEKRRRGIND